MKFFEHTFHEYITNVEKNNIHPELLTITKLLPDDIKELTNIIIYGPPGVGKYSQALYLIKKYSPSNLKYLRKIHIEAKRPFEFKIGDIHFEIDMELLGCNAKSLWNTIYYHISY